MDSHAKTHKNWKTGITYLLVYGAQSRTNTAQVEAVFREVLNISVRIEAPGEGCLKFLNLALVSGLVHVCWRYETREKKKRYPSLQ